jgi:class 3 adenylate cyclase
MLIERSGIAGTKLAGGARGIRTAGPPSAVFFRSTTGPSEFKARVRAGIHIGPVQVIENDVSGTQVNFTARIVNAIEGAEIWLSDEARKETTYLRALQWKQQNRTLKGFPGTFTLWTLS